MTRRGSLAYYLAAWVCGAFFFSSAAVITQPAHEEYPLALLMAFFIASAVAWPTLILFALLLRILAKTLSIRLGFGWAATGAVLAMVFGGAFSPFRAATTKSLGAWLNFQSKLFILSGPWDNRSEFGWVNTLATALAGMATAYVLFRIDRAFAPQEDASK